MNKNVNIRVASPNDAPKILQIYEPFILHTPVTFEEELPGVEAFQERIRSILESCPYLVCELNGEIIGYAYASAHRSRSAYRRNKEVSVYVDERFHRKKIARALYTCLLSILKAQGFTNLLAGISVPNTASVGFHESFGFEKCAEYHYIGYKLGKWHSVGWWELCLLDDKNAKPLEPIPFSIFQKQNSLNVSLEKGVTLLKN